MRFFKENSYDIVRVFINNIGITIFSLMLYSAAAIAEDNILTFNVLISCFSILFLCALLYYVGWDYGLKDRLSVDQGRMGMCKNRGLYLTLFASIPNFFFAAFGAALLGIHMLSGIEFFYTLFAICNVICRFIESMYIGVLQGIFSFLDPTSDLYFLLQSIGFTVFPLLAVLSTHFGYRSGLVGKHFLGIFSKEKGE